MELSCGNMSTVNISKNLVQHTRTKHIDIRHHFIRDIMEDKVVNLQHITTDQQLADIFTTPLNVVHFEHLRSELGVCICEVLQESNLGKYARRPSQILVHILYGACLFKVIFQFPITPYIWTFETVKKKGRLALLFFEKSTFYSTIHKYLMFNMSQNQEKFKKNSSSLKRTEETQEKKIPSLVQMLNNHIVDHKLEQPLIGRLQ